MPRRFVVLALAIALGYLALQVAYISRLPLVMDEFDGAYEAHQLLTRTPYKDFRPYKTVLGYYAQLPPLIPVQDPWSGLIRSKLWLAAINAAFIFGVTLTLGRLFSFPAAVASELLLVCVSTFLERSSEIRVDMLTGWVGLISFLLVLKRRWLLAGVLAGVSFFVSQKGIYYIVAANAAAGAVWLFETRDRQTFRDIVVLNVGVAATVLAYLAFWSALSSPWTVFSATFLAPRTIALTALYDLGEHWTRTLERNPVYYFGALAGFLVLIGARLAGRAGSTQVMVVAYGAALFALCRWHRQPWPYFFVILIPTLMVVHAACIDVLLRERVKGSRAALVVAGLVVLGGVVYPLTFSSEILTRNHRYQRYVIELAHALLHDGDTYVAGNDLVYDRQQTLPALSRLGAVQRLDLRQASSQRIAALIADIDRGHPKLVITNYRTRDLPLAVRLYLARRFDPFSASVNLYAPLVGPDEREFEVWFDGRYQIETETGGAVIDGQPVAAGMTLELPRGGHHNDSTTPVRLRLVPDGIEARLDPAMLKYRPMFEGVYDY
jgi:hypothetical protein